MAAIALFGMVAYQALPVSDLPNVDFPTLLVTAQLPGASPETMGASVATPLENQFSMIAGLESMTSVNSLGSTLVTLEFDLNRSLDGAAVDARRVRGDPRRAAHFDGQRRRAGAGARQSEVRRARAGRSARARLAPDR